MPDPREILSRLAARVGNWNDRHFAGDTRAESPAFYRSLDRLISRLYVQADKVPWKCQWKCQVCGATFTEHWAANRHARGTYHLVTRSGQAEPLDGSREGL